MHALDLRMGEICQRSTRTELLSGTEFEVQLHMSGSLKLVSDILLVLLSVCLFRQMQSEGGLKYQSKDHTVHQLSYQSLPPPLSLSAIKTEASSKT